MASSLETRYCEFERDGGFGNLGRSPICPDADKRTKLTHVEYLGCGIITSISCLAYGTWDGLPAALIILLFRLRASEGTFRLRKAELSLSFEPVHSHMADPIIRKIRPTTNRSSGPAVHLPSSSSSSSSSSSAPSMANSSPRTESSSTAMLWPPTAYTLSGTPWLGTKKENANQVVWRLQQVPGSKVGICETIPLTVVVTHSGPFQAIVRASGTTLLGIKVMTFPWSRDDPALFDGVTGKGWPLAAREFSVIKDLDLDQFVSGEGRTGTLARCNPGLSAMSETARPSPHVLESEPLTKVFRAHGIPSRFSRTDFIVAMNTALALPESTLICHSYSRSEHTAIISFSLTLRETHSFMFQTCWQIHIPEADMEQDIPSRNPQSKIKIYLDQSFLGFTRIGIDEAVLQPNVDIIAIHGLGGHAYGSFKQRGSNYMWLADSLLDDLCLMDHPNFFVRPRILLYGYDARAEGSDTFQSINDLTLQLKRLVREARRGDPHRPLIFLAHSLGGLLVKQLLIQIAQDPDSRSMDMPTLRSTVGILFFGVPNRGMEIGALLAIIGTRPNAELVASLSIGSAFLEEQADLFPRLFSSRHAMVYSFFETCVSRTATEVNGKLSMTGEPIVLLSRESATHSRPQEMNGTTFQIPLQRTHSDLVKFEPYSPDYVMVRGCIRDILSQ